MIERIVAKIAIALLSKLGGYIASWVIDWVDDLQKQKQIEDALDEDDAAKRAKRVNDIFN